MVIDFVLISFSKCSSEYFFDPYLTFFATFLRSMQFILIVTVLLPYSWCFLQ